MSCFANKSSRYFGADRSLAPELTLGTSSGDQAAVAIDHAGTALVVWVTEDHQRVVARRVRPDEFSATRNVTSSATDVRYASVSVGLDRDGYVAISYRLSQAGTPPRLRARTYSRIGTLGSVVAVSPGVREPTPHDEWPPISTASRC